ncbi:MAG: T9SS C-terminal target domain-containing protein [Balneolaceae bacterium]|nr:MAG: T9SS C-terminal target domain-containing protein [Balneolaceae bacterium]
MNIVMNFQEKKASPFHPCWLLLLLLLFFADAGAQHISPPVFSHEGGFYSEPFQLAITTEVESDVIYYTLDGSEPDPLTSHSDLPLLITDRTPEPNRLVNIRTTLNTTYDRYRWHEPDGTVDKATTVRAVAVSADGLVSEVATHTYWIGHNTRYSMPVVSLVSDQDHFFSDETGIYVHGSRMNYSGRGPDWERPIHVEYFNRAGNRILGQNAGVRIHGGWSRNAAQKTLRLYARSDYGVNRFYHPFFSGNGHNDFNRLLLRNSGNDFGFTMFRDAMSQMLVRHMNMDVQDYEPALVFLNGEYWGIHNLRERYDRHYLGRTHAIDSDRIDLLSYIHQIGETEIKEGDDSAYLAMKEYAIANDLSIDQHYAHVADRMDTGNYTDYFIAQIYFGNHDWPHNNIDFWRYRTDPSGGPAHPADGRFRWLLYDVDMSFGLGFGAGLTGYTNRSVEHATREHWSTGLFRNLLQNDGFRRSFLNRFILHMQTTFHPDRALGFIEGFSQVYEPEMSRHIERWPNHESMEVWRNDINVMRTFAEKRPDFILDELKLIFNTGGDETIHIGIPDPEEGWVAIEGVYLGTDLPFETLQAGNGIFTAAFHSNVPVQLTAIPQHGFVHSGWLADGDFTDADTLTIVPRDGKTIRPLFTTGNRVLLHYWHFNDPANLAEPAVSTGNAFISSTYNPGTELTVESGTDFSGLNARGNKTPGRHLRVTNAAGSALMLSLPTTGYTDPVLSFEAARSGAGAGTLQFSYSSNGISFTPFHMITIPEGRSRVYAIDLSDIPAASANPDFRIRIGFEPGDGGSSGYNDFDNITLEATPTGSGIHLPAVREYTSLLRIQAGSETAEIDLADLLDLGSAAPVTLDAVVVIGQPLHTGISGNLLSIEADHTGESLVRITATADPDGGNNDNSGNSGQEQVTALHFRVLSYPEPYPLSGGPFTFNYWDPDNEEYTWPAHMLFVQSNLSDPGPDTPMSHAYHIPHDDYHSDDSHLTGFPYATTRRSRINGLHDEGVGFINTGRGRDVGALILSLDTTGEEQAELSFTASTRIRNSRHYAIRLRYRTSIEQEFRDVLHNGEPVEYHRSYTGDTGELSQLFYGITLPEEMMGLPLAQLKWKYYHTGGRDTHESGARDKLSLSNISLNAVAVSIDGDADQDETPLQTHLLPGYPNPFNPETVIRYELAEAGPVTVDVFDITGRRVAVLVSADQTAGRHHTIFNARHLASGVYLIRLQSASRQDVTRVMLIK